MTRKSHPPPSKSDNVETVKPTRKSHLPSSKSGNVESQENVLSSSDDCTHVEPKNLRRASRGSNTAHASLSLLPSASGESSLGNIGPVDAKKQMIPLPPIRQNVPVKKDDPEKCLDILDRMYGSYYELERVYTPKPYLHTQKDINAKMRSILVDWLVEVHYKFKLHPSTLWLCVNILDRYLEKIETNRGDLQLVGVTSLLIACKYEEIYPPEVRDCVYITDYAYTRDQVLAMETKILRELDYQICVPTGYHFLTHFLNSFHANDRVKNLAFYYAERNLQEQDMLSYKPHAFVAAALYAALKYQAESNAENTRPKPVWTPELAQLSGLQEGDVITCARNIVKHVQEEPVTASKRQLIAAKKKYAAEKYNNISSLSIPSL